MCVGLVLMGEDVYNINQNTSGRPTNSTLETIHHLVPMEWVGINTESNADYCFSEIINEMHIPITQARYKSLPKT
jgi:hypothetical protein